MEGTVVNVCYVNYDLEPKQSKVREERTVCVCSNF